jgi:hypothetical protein
LSYLSLDWIPILLNLYRTLRRVLGRERHEGMYDILVYDATLELVNPKGETAVFSSRHTVRFLQCQCSPVNVSLTRTVRS